MNIRVPMAFIVSTFVVTASVAGWAQRGDLTHGQPATADANVDFGVLATGPLGPPPCAQTAATIAGPMDPCSFKLHHLTPEEVTIQREGEVTFQIHGGGHAMAIYEVSKDTTRNGIGGLPVCGRRHQQAHRPRSPPVPRDVAGRYRQCGYEPQYRGWPRRHRDCLGSRRTRSSGKSRMV
jgi:hypothetical protein